MSLNKNIYYTLFVLFTMFVNNQLIAQDLNSFIEKAIDQNPEIKKLQLQYDITTEKVNEANALPNTEFGAGYFVSEPETRTGPQKFKLSVKQMLPSFGSITARENYQNSLADVDFESISIAKRKLTASVASSYYNLQALNEKGKVITDNIELVHTYETLALKALEVNKASAVDVLKLQMKRNELGSKYKELQEAYNAELATFGQLLNTKDSLHIHWPEAYTLPISNMVANTDSLKLHPELVLYDKLYESVTQSEFVNQKSKNPMLGFGVDYINVAERTDMDMPDNGKDIFMPMVSVSVPLFNGTYKSKTKQHLLEQQKIQAAKEERFNILYAMLQQSIAKRNAAQTKYETQEKNIEQARHTEDIVLKTYENNNLNFRDLLDIQDLTLGFQMNRIDAALQYYIQSVMINYLSN